MLVPKYFYKTIYSFSGITISNCHSNEIYGLTMRRFIATTRFIYRGMFSVNITFCFNNLLGNIMYEARNKSGIASQRSLCQTWIEHWYTIKGMFFYASNFSVLGENVLVLILSKVVIVVSTFNKWSRKIYQSQISLLFSFTKLSLL